MGMCGLEGFDTFCHAPVGVGGEFDLNGIEHAVTFQEDVDLGPAGGAPVVERWAGGEPGRLFDQCTDHGRFEQGAEQGVGGQGPG